MTIAPARSFLFLQGPPGPFFRDLATGLRRLGHRCNRVNFNGGDWLDWQGDGERFTGAADAWPARVRRILDEHAITDIVMFGDCRPLHMEASRAARERSAIVHVFEEGYVRPDWITLERGGVNGFSSLPRRPETFLALAADLPATASSCPMRPSFGQRAIEAMRYYLVVWLLAPWFRRYRSHRPYSLAQECLGWARRLVARPLARRRSARALATLVPRSYFIVPLQLDSDAQIRTHSPFNDMGDALETIIASFARHAPADATLLIKEHPLDNGLRPWRQLVAAIAARHAVAGRVTFVEHGDLQPMVEKSRGVVTVNSTTGTLALTVGTPVIVLGDAVYDVPGITHQGDLASFWTAPVRPQLEIYEAFRRVLVARCLLRGGFSGAAARAALLPHAIDRLHAIHPRRAPRTTSSSDRQSA